MGLEALRGVITSEYRGPRAVFSEVHVLRAMLAIGSEGSVGRGRLGELVGLGQGEVRTLIKRLRENDLILIQPDGCRLSKKGEIEYGALREKIPWQSKVSAQSLGIGKRNAAVLVRDAAREVNKGIEQRDAAVRAGARGALTALYSGSCFSLPGERADLEASGPSELWEAARAADPRRGDVLIVVGADSEEAAEVGSLAAALTLLT
jgi:hypothetical protein